MNIGFVHKTGKIIRLLIYKLILLLCLTQATTYSQTPDSSFTRVDSILIVGNEITDADIILKELTFSIGDSIDASTIKYNKERIYSLGLFSFVEIEFIRKNTLNISVKEFWYIWPIPFVDIVDNDWKRISYGMDIVIDNFRGRNEDLKFRFGLGYNPAYTLQYFVPYLFRDEEIALGIKFSYGTVGNNSDLAETVYGENFSYKVRSAEVSIGKRVALFHTFILSFSHDYIETEKYLPLINASNDRIDRVFTFGSSYIYDTRDLKQFPSEGVFLSTNLFIKGFGFDGINHRIFTADFRSYNPVIGDLSTKMRVATRHAFGEKVPFYDRAYLGLSERVRGHYTDKREGYGLLVSSVELKYPIFKELNVTYDIPYIPKQFLTYRLALYLSAFFDVGGITSPGVPYQFKDFDKGYGIGLTFIVLPYNLARIEFASDEFGTTEWIFDFGISF